MLSIIVYGGQEKNFYFSVCLGVCGCVCVCARKLPLTPVALGCVILALIIIFLCCLSVIHFQEFYFIFCVFCEVCFLLMKIFEIM